MKRFEFNCNVGYAPVGPEPVCSCFIKIHSIISLPRSKCIWNNVPDKGKLSQNFRILNYEFYYKTTVSRLNQYPQRNG